MYKPTIKIFFILALFYGISTPVSAENRWLDETLNFVEQIEDQAFGYHSEDWLIYENTLERLPKQQVLSNLQSIAFLYVIAAKRESYDRIYNKYKPLLSRANKNEKDFQILLNIYQEYIERIDTDLGAEKIKQFIAKSKLNNDILLRAYIAIAYLHSDAENYADSLKSLQYAILVSETINLSAKQRYEFYAMRSYVLGAAGDHKGVIASIKNALGAATEVGLPIATGAYMQNIADTLNLLGYTNEALGIYQRIIELMPSSIDNRVHFTVFMSCGDLAYSLNKFRHAASCYENAESTIENLRYRRFYWLSSMVKTKANLQQLEEAQTLHQELTQLRSPTDSAWIMRQLARVEAELLHHQGSSEQAFVKIKNVLDQELISLESSQNEFVSQFKTLIDSETRTIQEKNIITDELIRKQKTLNVALAAGLIALILFSFYLYRNNQIEKIRAVTDPITELLNRRGFFEGLNQRLELAKQHDQPVVLGLINLDGFKSINTYYGREVGDLVLDDVAKSLAANISKEAIIGRLNADLFAIAYPDYAAATSYKILGDKLCEILKQERKIGGYVIELSASAGFVTYPEGGNSINELFDCADFVLQESKTQNKGSAKLFNTNHKTKLIRLRKLEMALSEAKEEEFIMFYQPIVDIQTNIPVGFEALARWNTNAISNAGPAEFIPVAERMGIINQLTTIFLRKALQEANNWPSPTTLSINLSSKDLNTIEAAEKIKTEILSSGFPPQRVVLELTETAIIEDRRITGTALNMLAEIGVKIALDDFGTGYSSLLHLLNFPIHRIKVDRTLTIAMDEKSESQSIVKLVIELCERLNLDCVVEGVEDTRHLDILSKLGKPLIQGYIFGKPMPPDQALSYLTKAHQSSSVMSSTSKSPAT